MVTYCESPKASCDAVKSFWIRRKVSMVLRSFTCSAVLCMSARALTVKMVTQTQTPQPEIGVTDASHTKSFTFELH